MTRPITITVQHVESRPSSRGEAPHIILSLEAPAQSPFTLEERRKQLAIQTYATEEIADA